MGDPIILSWKRRKKSGSKRKRGTTEATLRVGGSLTNPQYLRSWDIVLK